MAFQENQLRLPKCSIHKCHPDACWDQHWKQTTTGALSSEENTTLIRRLHEETLDKRLQLLPTMRKVFNWMMNSQ